MNQSTFLPVLQFDHVTVRYPKTTAALDVTLSVERGVVYAMLGRNGAGKSSLVRCLVGQQKPTAGRALLFAEESWSKRAMTMGRIGIVPEEPDLPLEMNAHQAIAFFAPLYSSWDGKGALDRLQRFGVPLTTPSGRLSKGQKRQLALALALASQPELLILDDPTLGLDVVARKDFYEELIGELADRGTTVFLTSHDLHHMERIANRVGILREGRLLVDDDLEAIKSRFRRIRFRRRPSSRSGETDVLSAMQVKALVSTEWDCEVVVAGFDEDLFSRFLRQPEVTEVVVNAMNLEDIFIILTDREQGDAQ